MLLLRHQLSSIYWLNISDRAIPFGGLIEHTNFIPRERYGGQRVLYISHYCYSDEPVYRFESRELFAHYRPGLGSACVRGLTRTGSTDRCNFAMTTHSRSSTSATIGDCCL
jgi:hypothetical protein